VILRVQKGSFDTALARVSKVAFIIKDIVDSIHQEIVWNQKEQGSKNKSQIYTLRNKKISREKGKCGVDPRNWS
jgi:hypothetical protein